MDGGDEIDCTPLLALFASLNSSQNARAINLHREDLGRQLYYNPVPPRNTFNVQYGDTYNFYINDTRPQYILDCLSSIKTILDGNRGTGQRFLQQAEASSEILRESGAKCRACSKIAAFIIYRCGHGICEVCGLRLKSQNWPCPVATCREPVLDIVKLNRS